ncbi:MAG: autotransporter-associated beta strand repeat-containing protein [bacterium]
MKLILPSSPRTLVSLAAAAALMASAFGAGETVTIDITAGGGFTPFIANPSGVAQDGYTVRVGAFLSANQSMVQALGYNKLWVGNQFTLFGSGTTETLLSQAGSFDPFPNLTNSSDALKGQKAWLVYSDAATLASSTAYGVATGSGADWTIPSASPWVSIIDTNDLTTVAYGTLTGTSGTDSLRTATAPATNLYWDANGAAGLGGSGTWSSATSATAWTTSSGGAIGSGPYAWGTTSGSNYYAGAGLTANFGGTAGTVTVSGTVDALKGLTFETTGYTLTSGTITLAGATAADNTITVNTGTATINSALSGSTGLTKEGSGTLALGTSNTYTGTTTVNSGTLQAAAAGALGTTSQVIVNNGGSLLVAANNAIGTNTGIELGTGNATPGLVFSGNYDGAVGGLTLSADSIIDLGSASVRIVFAGITGLSSHTLSIWNWSGNTQWSGSPGGGTDQISFTDASGLTGNLGRISFYSDLGQSLVSNSAFTVGSNPTEIIGVPEPGVYFTAAALLLGMGLYFLRRKYSRSEHTTMTIENIPTPSPAHFANL